MYVFSVIPRLDRGIQFCWTVIPISVHFERVACSTLAWA